MCALNLTEFVTLCMAIYSVRCETVDNYVAVQIRGSAVGPSRPSKPLGIPHLQNLRVINYT
jgi:hypothetical protein